jgi:hypothetical protein
VLKVSYAERGGDFERAVHELQAALYQESA